MNSSIHPSISLQRQTMYPSVHQHTIQPSTLLSTLLSTYPTIHTPTNPPTQTTSALFYPCTYPNAHPPSHHTTVASIHPYQKSNQISIHPSISQPIRPPSICSTSLPLADGTKKPVISFTVMTEDQLPNWPHKNDSEGSQLQLSQMMSHHVSDMLDRTAWDMQAAVWSL